MSKLLHLHEVVAAYSCPTCNMQRSIFWLRIAMRDFPLSAFGTLPVVSHFLSLVGEFLMSKLSAKQLESTQQMPWFLSSQLLDNGENSRSFIRLIFMWLRGHPHGSCKPTPFLLLRFWWIPTATYMWIWTTACWAIYNGSVWTQTFLKWRQGRRGGKRLFWYVWTWPEISRVPPFTSGSSNVSFSGRLTTPLTTNRPW